MQPCAGSLTQDTSEIKDRTVHDRERALGAPRSAAQCQPSAAPGTVETVESARAAARPQRARAASGAGERDARDQGGGDLGRRGVPFAVDAVRLRGTGRGWG